MVFVGASQYQCYSWDSEANSTYLASHGETLEAQLQVCNSVGGVFTRGANDNFPGCGGCWCCTGVSADGEMLIKHSRSLIILPLHLGCTNLQARHF